MDGVRGTSLDEKLGFVNARVSHPPFSAKGRGPRPSYELREKGGMEGTDLNKIFQTRGKFAG